MDINLLLLKDMQQKIFAEHFRNIRLNENLVLLGDLSYLILDVKRKNLKLGALL